MIDETRDIPNLMLFPLVDGNVLKAERRDPYGHWFFVLQKGNLPEDFQGGYTSRDEIRKAVAQYSKYRDIPQGDQPSRPVLKYKKIKNGPTDSNLD